jgi:hypothetical protein
VAVRQVHDGGVLLGAAPRHGDERTGTHPAQALHVVFLVPPAPAPRELAHALAVTGRRQFVGRQHRELAGKEIALRGGAARGEPVPRHMAVEPDRPQRASWFLLALGQPRPVDPRRVDGKLRSPAAAGGGPEHPD